MVKTYSFLLIAIFCEVAGTMLLASITKLYKDYSNSLSYNILSSIFLFNDLCYG